MKYHIGYEICYMCVYIYACMWIWSYIYICSCIYIYIYIYMYMYICECMYVNICICVNVRFQQILNWREDQQAITSSLSWVISPQTPIQSWYGKTNSISSRNEARNQTTKVTFERYQRNAGRPDTIHYLHYDSIFFQQLIRFHLLEINIKNNHAMIQKQNMQHNRSSASTLRNEPCDASMYCINVDRNHEAAPNCIQL